VIILQISFDLPELDRKKTKEAVEDALATYRMFKYLTYEEHEATTTASYTERLHGPTNETSDQTADVAIGNVSDLENRKNYCTRIERAVKRLPPMERLLIEKRYMGDDAEYITDHAVYTFRFDPPISEGTYSKIRWRAFYKLALNLKIEIIKGTEEKN
jgi:ArpU family phage transcriptional regulator